MGKEAEDGKGAEDSDKAEGDGCQRGGLGDEDPGPHVEEGGGVSVGVAEEGILTAVVGAGGGDLGVGHGAKEGEQAAGDPDGVDHDGGAGSSHHLPRDEKDAGADDDADDDGGSVRGGEDARELRRRHCGR